MLHAREAALMENVVLQTPFAFACHRGTIDQFECSDALIVNDFEAMLKELSVRGFVGLALLIDEADCLGKNVPLLQMFRNIFQIVPSCSLLLAGTEAVFPVLSDVFSPIPLKKVRHRQCRFRQEYLEKYSVSTEQLALQTLNRS